jgi:hypothetical protein
LEKGKELVPKDTDKEPFFDDTKVTVDLLRSAFTKLEDVGAAFNIKAHHDVYKDSSVQGLAFRIHGLAHRHFVFDDDGSDGSDDSHDGDDGNDGSHCGDDGGTPTVVPTK